MTFLTVPVTIETLSIMTILVVTVTSDIDCSDSDCSDSDCIVTVVTVLLQVIKWARTKDKFR